MSDDGKEGGYIEVHTSGEHSKIDHLAQRGVTLVTSTDAVKYGLVDVEVVGTPSILNTKKAINVIGIVVGDLQD